MEVLDLKLWKRALAMFLAMNILFSNFPISTVAAQAEDGTCQHHTHPSDDCSYRAAVPEQKCSHTQHNESCYAVSCLHTEHSGCAYDPGVPGSGCECPVNEETGEKEHDPETCTYQEGRPATACDHKCTTGSGCVTDTLICGHTDDGLCHYTAAVEGVACNFVCEICQQDGVQPVDNSDKCICGDLEKCTAENRNADCPVCTASESLEADCLGHKSEPLATCICEGKDKCTNAATSSCPACCAAGEDLSSVCLGKEATPPAPACICGDLEKCTEGASNQACPVCKASADLQTDCKGNEVTDPQPICTCVYKCEKAEDAGDCPACGVEGGWKSCAKESKPLECTCKYQCTEGHEDDTCAYCAQNDDCKQTLVWEQKYGKVQLTLKWDDLSNEFGYRDAMSKLFAVMDGDKELIKLSFSFADGGDQWNITIDTIPLYKEYSEEMVDYTLKLSDTDAMVAAYQINGSGTAALTGYNVETGEFEPVVMEYDLILDDVTGSVTWDSDEHPSIGYFFSNYFGAKLGDKDLADRVEYSVDGNTYNFVIKDVPQKSKDGSAAQYILTAGDVGGFQVDGNTKTATTEGNTVFEYTRQVEYIETAGTKVKLNWLDGSGTDKNMHPGELELNLSYTYDGTKYTITDIAWDEDKGAYVHEWTEEEKLRLFDLRPGDEGYDAIEDLIIQDKGNNSLSRTLETNRLQVPRDPNGESLVSWGAPVIKKVNFTPKALTDGVFVDEYEMEWFNGGYRMTPLTRVTLEVNLRSGDDSKQDVLDLLKEVAKDGVNGDKVFALKGNNGFQTQYLSAAEVLSGTPEEITVNGKTTLLYTYETLQKAYDSTDKKEMVYTIDCEIRDGHTVKEAGAENIDGYHGYDLEYNNINVPGKGGYTNTAYDGGRIILTKTGNMDYRATKLWLDDGDDATVASRPNATYTLWRYAVGDYSNASQVELDDQYLFSLDKSTSVVPIGHLDLPRFDPDGYEYTYLIREQQASSSYEKVIGRVDQETGEITDYLPEDYQWNERRSSDTSIYHDGVFSNRKVGTLPHTVTKTWKAAYYQDLLQNIMVEMTVFSRHISDEADAELREWTEYDKVYLDGFDALHYTVTNVLDLPRYDHMGHEIEYKVVETDIREIGVDPLSEDDTAAQIVGDVEDIGLNDELKSTFEFVLPMNLRTLEAESIEGATDYFVSTSTTTVEKDENGRNKSQKTVIVNELKGETAFFIRKTWDESLTPSDVTFTLGQNSATSGFRVYGTETIEAATAYKTNSHDSGWIRGEWKDGKWQLPRYDAEGNVYTYMVLEEDNNSSYQSEIIYGYDVDNDKVLEKNAAMIHNAPIGISRYINVRKVWYDDSANTDRAPAYFRIEATGVTPNAVVYGTGGLMGDNIVVNEQSNWWDKVNVTLFLHEDKLYTTADFKADAGRDPVAADLYTGGFRVTEVAIGTSQVGNAADTDSGFNTVQNGNTRFAVMYNHPDAAADTVLHGDGLNYNKTGAVAPIVVSSAQTLMLLGIDAYAEDEGTDAGIQTHYNRNEFYTVTNLRIGTYNVTVDKSWEDDLTVSAAGEANSGTAADGMVIVRPEATFVLACTEYANSINKVDGANNDSITVSPVLHPEGKLPILNNENGQTDAEQKLKGDQDKENVYFCNLPLYDHMGKIIHYTVSEELPDGVKYQSINTGLNLNYSAMNTGKLNATQGFVNKPQHTYNVSFHLLWLDQYRQDQNQRPDVYLKLYSMSGDQTEPVAMDFAEYHWTHNAAGDTSADAWTYTFAHLPEFDERGHKITYYAKIFTVADEKSQDYIDLQYGAGQDTTLDEWSGESKLTDVNQMVSTYPVRLNGNNKGVVLTATDGSLVMKQDNTFIYQIKDDMKITGKKIWDAVPEGFPAEDLPVLNFILRNKAVTGEIRAVVWKCENENYTYTFDIYKVGMCDKNGNLIDLEQDAEAKAYWQALVDAGKVTSLPYGSLMPRYDEEGNLDTYYLGEEIYAKEIKGVDTKVSYENHWGDIEGAYQLRNTFNQTETNQSEIKITKKWLKNNISVEPASFDFPEKVTFKLYRFYYDIFHEEYGPLTAPSEMPNDQVNAPGDPIAIVEITKDEILKADGDVVKSFGSQWVYAPNGTPFIYYIEEVKLNGYDPMSMELPAGVNTVARIDGKANWPAAIGSDWHTAAFNLVNQLETNFTLPADNNYIAENVSLSGAKIWTDHQNSQNTRPDSLELKLYRKATGVTEELLATVTLNSDGTATVAMADGEENVSGTITATVNATSNKGEWSYTISNLDKFYSTTAVWSYKIRETVPAKYTGYTMETGWKDAGSVKTITGMNLTNVLQTNVKATKKWELLNEGVEVPTIKVALQVSTDGRQTWKFARDYFTDTRAWTNMPAFETTLTTGKTTVEYKNLPKGFGQVGKGYKDFAYRVVETEIDGKTVSFDANGNYSADNGTEYIITNSTPTISSNTHNNTITNKPDDEVTEFTVTKIWFDDNGNAFYTRGGSVANDRAKWSVTFELWRYQVNANGQKITDTDERVLNRNGNAYISLTVNQNSADHKASIGNLASKTADGNAYVYYAKEQGITDNGHYFGSYEDTPVNAGNSADGFTTDYTNDLITTELSVTKVWYSHDNNPVTFQPDQLEVTLWQSSANVASRNITDWYKFKDHNWNSKSWTKNSDGTWTVTFTDLPKYDSKGAAYTYTVKENRLDGYLKPVLGATGTDNSGNQSQEITNIPTLFYMDKVSSVDVDTKLKGVKLVFGNAETKAASTTLLTWERGTDGAESYRIVRNDNLWSSGGPAAGNVAIQGLPVGTYYLVEEPTIPEGYTNSAVGTSFTLSETGVITVGDTDFAATSAGTISVGGNTYYKYRLNVKDAPTELSLTKKGKNNATLTEGYLFSIIPAEGSKFTNGNVKYIAGEGVDIPDDGEKLAKADLIQGHTYVLKEEKAPDYYLRSFGTVTFKLDPNGNIAEFNKGTADASDSGKTITFKDAPYGVALEKTSSKDASLLPNAQFKLQKWNGSAWADHADGFKTDSNGRIQLDSVTHNLLLSEGTTLHKYRLLETVATPGYELILDEQSNSASYVEFYAKQNEDTGALEVYQDGSQISVDAGLKLHKLTMTNTPIDMNFVKMDMGDALQDAVVMAGVKFTLEAVGNSSIPTQVDITDENGKLYFGPAAYSAKEADYDHKFMVIGHQTYKLTETLPDGYENQQLVRQFTVTRDGKFSFEGKPETFTIENTRIPGNVELVKKDNKGNVMDGVTFTMKDNKGTAITVQTGKAYVARYDADDKLVLNETGTPYNPKTGKLSVTGLAWGAYSLEETVPTGYKTPGFTQTFQVTKDNAESGVKLNTNNTIINTPVEVEVWKVDAKDTKTPIPGAVYKLFDSNDNEITANTAYGDRNIKLYNNRAVVNMPMWSWNQTEGKGTAFRLTPGTYTLKETTVPAGYEQAADFTFTVNVDGSVTSAAPKNGNVLLAVDNQIEFKLEKKDSVTGSALDGVTFKVTCNGSEVGTKVTHDGGVLTFGYANANPKPDFAVEASKTYVVEEVDTVNGYELMTGTFSFKVNADGTISKQGIWADCVTLNSEGLVITANNTPIEITLVKKAAGTGVEANKTLAGVQFTLTGTVDGETVTQTDTTDSNGMLYFRHASASDTDHTFAVVGGVTYTLSETTPAGYAPIDDIIFTVTEDGKLDKEAEDPVSVNTVREEMTILNQRLPGSVMLTKEDYLGYTINGVAFTLFRGDTEIGTVKTGNVYTNNASGGLDAIELEDTGDTIGTLVIHNLPWDDYTLVETVPVGYRRGTTQSYNFTINENDAKKQETAVVVQEEITVVNTPVVVNVMKVDADATAPYTALTGAEYELYKRDGNVDTKIEGTYNAENYVLYDEDQKVVTIDLWNWDAATGTGTAYRLEEGSYVLKEVTLPAGYEKAADITFKIDADGNVTSVSSATEDGTILAKDTKISFKLVKKDAVTGETMEGVRFKVTAGDVTYFRRTDENGEIIFGHDDAADIPVVAGTTYTVEEVETLNGYELMSGTFSFTVNDSGSITEEGTWAEGVTLDEDGLVITALNTPIDLTLIKKDGGDGIEGEKIMSGVEFTLTGTVDGKTVTQTTTTNDEGKIFLKNVAGENTFAVVSGVEYTLTESTPDGYVTVEPITFTITADGKLEMTAEVPVSVSQNKETMTIVNQRMLGDVTLIKKDAKDYFMNGVEFDLYMEGTKVTTVTTGNSYTASSATGTLVLTDSGDTVGTIMITNLPWGEYELREQQPVGYTTPGAGYPFEIAMDGGDAKVFSYETTVTNTPVEVTVYKVNGDDTTEILSGAVYKLYDAAGNEVTGNYDTGYTLVDADGNVVQIPLWSWSAETGTGTAFRLAPGSYVLKEITPPAGYEKAADISFTISTDGNLTVDAEHQSDDGAILAKDTKISFQLIKKDAVNGEALDGVKFTLSDGTNEKTVATHDGGILTFGHEDDADFAVVAGTTYTLTETAAIYGYELIRDSITFKVEEDGTVTQGWEGQWTDSVTGATVEIDETGLVITVNNARTPGEIILTKSEYGTNDKLNDITFTLYRKTEGGWFTNFLNFLTGKQYKVAATFDWSGSRTEGDITENAGMRIEGGTDGVLRITGLEWGTYKLVETNADGYVLNGTTANQVPEFTIGKDKTKNEVLTYTPNAVNSPIRFTLIKTDASGNTELPGEVFTLYHYDNGVKTALNASVKWNKMDQNGNDWYEGNHLPKGDYLLEETTPPAGYQVGASVVFTVNADGTIVNIRDTSGKPAANAEILTINSVTTIKIKDTPISFKLIKKDFLNDKDLLEGVEFTLTCGDETQVKKTNAKGELTFGAPGSADFVVAVGNTYTLTETKTIYGYELLQKSITFTVLPDGTIQPGWEGAWKDTDENGKETGATVVLDDDALIITATNIRTLGKVVLTKIDSETREKINGVTFTLYKKVSGETWFANFLNFLTGKQYEVAAEFNWDETRVTDENLIDTAMQIGAPEDGVLEISGLTWGSYKLVEKAADGYILQEEVGTRTCEFAIGKDKDAGEVLVYEKTVQNIPNKFTLIKVDLDGKKLSGEEYTLAAYNAQTGTETAITDPAKWEKKSQGTGATLDDWYEGTRLPKGDYILKEVTPPSGYRIADPIVFTVTADGKITNLRQLVDGKLVSAEGAYIEQDDATKIYAKDEMTEFSFNKVCLINEILTDSSVTETVKDPDATAKLAGAKFTAYADAECTVVVKPLLNCDELGQVTSDSNGVVTFKGLPLGSYYIKETTPSEGHVLLETVFQVDITSEDGIVLKNVTGNTVINDVYRGQISFNKVSELDATKAIPGAEYGLYAGTELIAKAVSEEDGRVCFDGLLMDVVYTIKELKVSAGSYVSKNPVKFHFEETDGVVSLIIDDDGDGTITETDDGILWNEPQTRVLIQKVDSHRRPLAGAKLQIQDEDGNVITLYDKDGKAFTSWISKKKPLDITGQLEVGKTYRLVELRAPSGYVRGRPVRFVIEDEEMEPGQETVLKVRMVNKRARVNPKTGDEMPIERLMTVATVSGLSLLLILAYEILRRRRA